MTTPGLLEILGACKYDGLREAYSNRNRLIYEDAPRHDQCASLRAVYLNEHGLHVFENKAPHPSLLSG
jgi:hypothetical protein